MTDATPVRLSGGNPRIPKGCGDAAVQAYIAAMPGWTRAVGEWIDGIVTDARPGVQKAVKWNTPLYGLEQGLWFLSFHCMTAYVKVGFLNGAELSPPPPGPSRQPRVRYLDIREGDPRDAAQFARWVRQAGERPGERL